MEKDSILLHVKPTRAEFMTLEERKKHCINIKSGLVMIKQTISRKELKVEFDQIIKALTISEEEGLKLYIKFMRDSMSSCFKKKQ